MRPPIIIFLLLALAGAGLLGGGYYFWRSDPGVSFAPASGTVLNHDLQVDGQRWNGLQKEALRLETKVRLDAGDSRGGTILTYFIESTSAYELMAQHPVGAPIHCLASADGTELAWPRSWCLGSRLAMLLGTGLLTLSGLWFWKFPQWRFPSEAWIIGTFGSFGLAGVLAAWSIWPGVIKQIQAASWVLIPYERVEERWRGSRRQAVSEHVIHYQFKGKSYLANLSSNETPFQGVPQNLTHCMVNPAQPWVVSRSWGWRPMVGIGLFPIPFLAIGGFGLLLLFVQLTPQTPPLCPPQELGTHCHQRISAHIYWVLRWLLRLFLR